MKGKEKKRKKGAIMKSFRTQKQMWAISGVALIWVLIFCYIPMLGNVIAFFDYVPGKSLLDCEFIGLETGCTAGNPVLSAVRLLCFYASTALRN